MQAPIPYPRLVSTAIVLTAIVCLFARSLVPTRDTEMTAIGSVFLGDVQRHRHLSSSTPPSSPPPHIGSSAPHTFSDLDDGDEQKSQGTKPPSISPILSLELRLRWLETLLYGAKHDDQAAKPGTRVDKLKDGETLARRAEDLQRRLDSVAQSNDALKRFMERCGCSIVSLACYTGLCVHIPAASRAVSLPFLLADTAVVDPRPCFLSVCMLT